MGGKLFGFRLSVCMLELPIGAGVDSSMRRAEEIGENGNFLRRNLQLGEQVKSKFLYIVSEELATETHPFFWCTKALQQPWNWILDGGKSFLKDCFHCTEIARTSAQFETPICTKTPKKIKNKKCWNGSRDWSTKTTLIEVRCERG